MKEKIDILYSNIINKPFNNYTFILFQKGIYLFLILYFLHLIPVADIIFGTNSLIPKINNINGLTYLFNIFQINFISKYYWVVLIVYLILLIKGLLFKQTSIIEPILVYYLTINFFNKSFLLNSGAQQVISLMLFYMIFVNNRKINLNYYENLISKLGVLACKVQIVILYFFSAYYKYYGKLWLNGEAVYYSLKIENYNPFWITSNIDSNNLILTITNYLTLAYLTLFPLIALSKNKVLLIIGIFMHLSIFYIMGINDFGLIMVVVYLIFLPKEIAKKILNFFQKKRVE